MEWVQARGAAGSGIEEAAGAAIGQMLGIVLPVLGLLLLLSILGGLAKRSRRAARKGGRGWSGPRRSVKKPAPLLDDGSYLPLRPAPAELDDSGPTTRPHGLRFDRGAEQMRAVEENGFERKPLLNRGETRLLGWLDAAADAAGQGHRVMAQVALNEVIRPRKGASEAALGAIVAKRLDFAIVDRDGWVACAVEFQGRGHWGNHAAMRDAVKREALRKAGVRLVEVHHDATEKWVRDTVGDLLGPAPCSPGNTGGIEQTAPS